LQASKNKPVPTLEQRIEELSAENGQLRHEMLYFQHMHDAIEEFQKEVRCGKEIMEKALEDLEKIQQQLDDERTRSSNVYFWREKSN
jgi:prefoldin subunit 5